MANAVQRKQVDPSIPEGAPWCSLHKAASILGESRDRVAKRALMGEIRTSNFAHVLLFLEADVRAVADAKRAAAATDGTQG